MSNDQTPDDLTTKPTLETVLERINAVGEKLTSRMDVIANDVAQLRIDMNQRFATVDTEIANLRRDVERGFRVVERKIMYLNDEFLERRRVVEDLEIRIEELENKAS
jgi:hypothetical protein